MRGTYDMFTCGNCKQAIHTDVEQCPGCGFVFGKSPVVQLTDEPPPTFGPSPRHLAATIYTVIFLFRIASWSHAFYVELAIVDVLTLAVAIAFWSKRSVSFSIAPFLVCVSVGLMAWARLWFDTVSIIVYGLGCVFAIWSCWWPNTSFKRDAQKRAP